ncbi:hypothetical protein EMPS_09811 [Entomortierella parvispora]|uniref:Crinkler effector protein N-terminal domain-containing protein n=1 Tax=Entomortierella parvispora TaxID=205924 RepID=A0A9P3M0Q7_9FUNG|nr:hypothetical protein EMPS_09811 [Entomortierella parvispora]
MAATIFTFFCLVSGDPLSAAFNVEVSSDKTIITLREAIKKSQKDAPEFGIPANNLVLWQATIPTDKNAGNQRIIALDGLDDKTQLDDPRISLSELFPEGLDDSTYIIVERPKATSTPQEKRDREDEALGGPSNKKFRNSDRWEPYEASDGKVVELPSTLFDILKSTEFEPNPRRNFAYLKGRLKAGDSIIVPEMGQEPKDFGRHIVPEKNRKKRKDLGKRDQVNQLFVTEQMLELWQEMYLNQDETTYLRVLSGPMGVGKSYLSYFLAAKAYAEGWLVLYFSDASELDTRDENGAMLEVVKRFLGMNKDILTGADLEKLVKNYNGLIDELTAAVSTIFRDLLKSKDRNTLLLVDEHGKLFDQEPYVPNKFKSLTPLKSFTWWGQRAKGCRVVFTGTAHARYEMTIMEDVFRNRSVVFVGPFSQTVFLKLLDTYPRLNRPEIKREVVASTNCVPRELLYLSESAQGSVSVDDVKKWVETRAKEFLDVAQKFYDTRSLFRQKLFTKALSQTFLGSSRRNEFEWDFMDHGLIYRTKEGSQTRNHILCRPAQKALLDLFRSLSLPEDIKRRINIGKLGGDDFETALFHQLICADQPVLLNATDLNGRNKTTIKLEFDDFDTLKTDQTSLGPGYNKVLCRGYQGYPRFDYMLGEIFIQVSISDFQVHNTKNADILEAFKKGFKGDPSRNQIEYYLDDMYGPTHTAVLDSRGKFLVRRNGSELTKFRIVYIRGSPGGPAHNKLVQKFKDVAHISFEELKETLFNNIV